MAQGDVEAEIRTGARFAFGENWRAFVEELDDERVDAARASLRDMLYTDDLSGMRFLDAGSGSGLFSLAARTMGAEVVSFDVDPDSNRSTAELRRRCRPDDTGWRLLEGSVLDRSFLQTLGSFDVVYCWGVVHHTGAMYEAMENIAGLAAPGGLLYVAVYNDQGLRSRLWHRVKRRYNRSTTSARRLLLACGWSYFSCRRALGRLIDPARAGRGKIRARGMSATRDLVDWMGGYPFEVARPEEVFDFYRARGFDLLRLRTTAGLGCNEFVFRRPVA